MKRLYEPDSTNGESTLVANHYSKRLDYGKDFRRLNFTDTLNLRNFNNWVKNIALSRQIRRGDTVLDLCHGKGGEIQKFEHAGVKELVAVDLAEGSIEDAKNRYKSMVSNGKKRIFDAYFFVMDCHLDRIEKLLNERKWFDVVTCMFALHYSWQTEERANGFMRNIVCRLRSGGSFVCTIPDADVLFKRLAATETKGLKFGNSIYSVDFSCSPDTKTENKDLPFGIRYSFTLKGAVEDCPEYVVCIPALKTLASKYGLDLVGQENFKEMHVKYSNHEHYGRLLGIMKVGTLSPEECEVASLYTTLVFIKK
jgi:mRNA (guanine-N7-)-methyltransferase